MTTYDDMNAALHDPDFVLPSPEETVMLISHHNQIFELNLMAAFIWDMLDGKQPLEDLTYRIIEMFKVDKEIVQQDLQRLVEKLIALDLVSFSEEH